MTPDLKQLREHLRRLRQLSQGELQGTLSKMQRECQALVLAINCLDADAGEPIDLPQIKGVTATLGRSVDSLIGAIEAGTFRDFGGPEQLIDELISSGREPTPEELGTIVAACQSIVE